ncbi:MAG TPA: RagB/SusD family nutrient uptake outer membrane protein [Gemmatimonadaceae bacterium]|nr:RagB/SusD family nutrient uptake outer membrane protein [Gemmatimonadaceae bacterium]
MTNFRTFGFALLLLAGAASCDTKVTNPGPVKDSFLQGEEGRLGMSALVAGAGRAVGSGINWVGYTGAAVTREIHPAGSTGSFGITNRWQNGELNPDDVDLNTHWEQAQRARWVSEEAVRRMEAQGPPPAGSAQTLQQYNNLLQLAYLYAGFANRVLGDNMCDFVIDGSGVTAGNTGYYQRADSLFTKAIGVTGANVAAQLTAAYGGRASARAALGQWATAIADAQQVPIAFAFNMPYYNIGDDAQRNRIFYSSGNTRESGSAYRAHTQWNTWQLAYKYGSATTLTSTSVPVVNDPRIAIVTSSQPLGDAAIDCCGKVPFFPEAKHASSAAPIRLTSGREMQLIRAEERLLASDDVNAMAFINAVRTNAGAPTITNTDLTDAWRLLKRERGIELWLEARRLGDRRRWAALNTPGALDPLEMVGTAASPHDPSHLARQDLCFPVSRSERDANPQIP